MPTKAPKGCSSADPRERGEELPRHAQRRPAFESSAPAQDGGDRPPASARQHTQATHDQVYLLPDPRTRAEAAPVIADGITAALNQARPSFKAQIQPRRRRGHDGDGHRGLR